MIRKAFSITGLDRLLDLEDEAAVTGPVAPDPTGR
jgi:hypothetical protein